MFLEDHPTWLLWLVTGLGLTKKNGIPTIVLFYGVEHISIGLVKNIYFMFNISMVAGVGSTDHQASKNHDSYGIIRQVSMKVHEGAFLQQQ